MTPKKAKAPAKPRRGTVATAPVWMPKFLAALAESCNVTYSATVAGTTRKTAYAYRGSDPEFAAAWEDAEAQGVEALEMAARRRAMDTSDTLAIFLLKAHRPEKYRERVEHTGKDGGPLQIEYVNDWRTRARDGGDDG